MIEGITVIYITGPMSGLEEYNHPAFHAAESYLQEHRDDAELMNPAWNYNGSPQVNWQQYMRRSIRQVMEATELYVLKGWEASKGAQLEVSLAKALGLKLTFEGGEL